MTTAHVEKFAELVGKDPALLARLGLDKVNADATAAAASAAAFITNAVKEAKAHGLQFTEEECREYLAAEAKAGAGGELSDTQLEAVAGGKNAHAIHGIASGMYEATGQGKKDREYVAAQFPGTTAGGRFGPTGSPKHDHGNYMGQRNWRIG